VSCGHSFFIQSFKNAFRHQVRVHVRCLNIKLTGKLRELLQGRVLSTSSSPVAYMNAGKNNSFC